MSTAATNQYTAPNDSDSQPKQPCYISTPAHVASFVGRFIYIYTGKGTIEQTPKILVFTYRNGTKLVIGLDTIVKIERGSYSRWAKPFGLDFIAVNYASATNLNTVYFTPTRSAMTPTWKTNKIVTQWMDVLQKATKVQ